MLDGLMPAAGQRASLTTRAEKYAATVGAAASYLAARGIDQQAASSHLLGLVSDPEPQDERFRGWLSLPYVTAQGDVIAMKFRRLEGEGNKYDGPAGQKQHLYEARSLKDGGEVAALCEGELDAIVAQKVLDIPCAATPGTQWLPHWPRCFSGFEKVLVIADHDAKDDGSDPGRKHAEKVVKELGKHVSTVELVLPPAGMDFTDWVKAVGEDVVRERVLGLQPEPDYGRPPY